MFERVKPHSIHTCTCYNIASHRWEVAIIIIELTVASYRKAATLKLILVMAKIKFCYLNAILYKNHSMSVLHV